MTASPAAVGTLPVADRAARAAERLLRVIGDGRSGLVLLAATAVANAVAALLPDGPSLLAAPWYAVLLGALALSGVATVAVRGPIAWREWRRPSQVQPGRGALEAVLAPSEPDRIAEGLAALGYRVRVERSRGRWAVHAVRRGPSRFAGVASHLALVIIVLGAALGAAFGSETVFSLLPGDQALLDAPRPGFSSAVRLDSFDADFGAEGRPTRLDTTVSFVREGSVAEAAVLRVNEPGDFDGYLVHPWTYGPAAHLRVATLGGSALLDAPVPLDAARAGVPVGSSALPSVGLTLGLALTDAETNELGVSVVGAAGLIDSARLRPGQEARIGDLVVELTGFDAWVTFLSRRDPGQPILLLGGILLSVCLAVAFWMPRRRVTVRRRGADLLLVLRGERFDWPLSERDRLVGGLGSR